MHRGRKCDFDILSLYGIKIDLYLLFNPPAQQNGTAAIEINLLYGVPEKLYLVTVEQNLLKIAGVAELTPRTI